jgi:hypothetical protein
MLSELSSGVTAPPVRLAQPLDRPALSEIERQLHLRFQKWDTQVGDISVLCEHALVLPASEWKYLCESAEALATEIEQMEALALGTPGHLAEIGVPRAIRKILERGAGRPAPTAARNMRFDFHPTATGWSVSEVNTDVPGGWREGTTLPHLYRPFCSGLDCAESPLAAWGDSIASLKPHHVALLSAPGYLEDQQVLRTFRGELESRQIPSTLIQTPAALDWSRSGGCRLAGAGTEVSAVVRFYQLEWLCALPASTGWRELLTSPITLNPTVSAISESKRFPLLIRDAGTCPAMRALLPECRDPREIGTGEWADWVLKACYSNTGEQVLIVGNLGCEARQRAIREAQGHPFQWVAQRRFVTTVLESCRGPLFPCVGVFVVGGRAAGAYVRLSSHQVTDGAALEAPLLIDRMSAP